MKVTVKAMQLRGGQGVVWEVSCAGSCGNAEIHAHVVRRVTDWQGNDLFVCDCPAYARGGNVCRHMKAVWRNEKAAVGLRTVFSKTLTAAKSQHRPVVEVRSGAHKLVYATHRKVGKIALPKGG
jgi:hypothetical protein